MPSHHKPLASFISYLTLLLAFVVLAEPARAQTTAEPAPAPKSEAIPVAAVSGSASAQAVALNAETDPAKAKADSASTESGDGNATADPLKDLPPPPFAETMPAAPVCSVDNTVNANVVAIAQPLMLNRLGAAIPNGLVFTLQNDLNPANQTTLRPGRRPRPLVLRANVGDCLKITFTNKIQSTPTAPLPGTTETSIHVQGMEWVEGSKDDGSFVGDNNSSLAIAPSSVPPPSPTRPRTRTYTLYAKAEGTYLLYTMGDTSTVGDQLLQGLFGAVNIQPTGAEWYRSQVTADDLALATYNANRLPSNATLSPSCTTSAPCTLTTTKPGSPPKQVKVIKTQGGDPQSLSFGNLNTLDNHPLINYDAVYPAGAKWLDGTTIPAGTPILKMLDAGRNLVYSDLTAMITGPGAGRFPGAVGDPNKPEPPCNAENNPTPPGVKVDPLFCGNPASPDRKQPYREITIIYHGSLGQIAAQAFPIFNDPNPANSTDPAGADTMVAGQDAFAINYGTGGIGAEIYANRIGVGPMGDCVDCKYEEFFLSAWSVGDPAMLVNMPANSNHLDKQKTPAPPPPQNPPFVKPCNTTATFNTPPCGGKRIPGPDGSYTLKPTVKATVAFFPEDPSNVYHSYINDHVKFRILHGGVDVSHVHHQHAHQWLQSPNSDQGSYLDSQMISPGASYTLEMVYNGSGNRNKVVGDSIFHCHFYPHFAAGMWAMWRTHDVFESGTYVYPRGSKYPLGTIINGKNVSGQDRSGLVVPGSRALPDGEIIAGVPTPAIVPLPTLPMAPLPAYAQIQNKVVVNGAKPAYAQIQNKVEVNGAKIDNGGQVVIGGTCQGNQINGLDVIGDCANGQQLNGTVINSQFDGTQMTGQFQPSPSNQLQPSPSNQLENPGFPCDRLENPGFPCNRLENPGFPYFIPGVAGARAPHPPMDFACAEKDADGKCKPDTYLDGGLPRHVVIGGSVSYERHTKLDWSKDLATIDAIALPEDGTDIEKAAITFFRKRCYQTSFPDGTPGSCPSPQSTAPQMTQNTPPTGFILNGLPRGPQQGAPFADPAVDDNGKAIDPKRTRIYKAAAIQLDVTFNKQKWHYPQQRILTLWKDAQPTLNYKFGDATSGRPPEPLFFRGNSGDILEYWHTNLVPNYFLVDDFQVRTPTDILGQHIHLVKFDVTSSDGAANGFNYEDGTFSPQEVQEIINGINHSASKGFINAKHKGLEPTLPPSDIINCAGSSDPRCKPCPENWTPTYRPQCQSWMGAQTTIQRWYLDPLLDNSSEDRTLRTVFTHDHFGPSTHQQIGLYAGLLVEPKDSVWKNSEDGTVMGARLDGGPTSWKADILTTDKDGKNVSYREFALEFQDFQLAYIAGSKPEADPNPSSGWLDSSKAILPPKNGQGKSFPQLISTAIDPTPGTHSVNYLNEPLPWRIGTPPTFTGKFSDLSYVYDNSIQATVNPPAIKGPTFLNPDPMTPLMRAYQNDSVQIRILVGAHTFAHQFNLEGPTWFSEPSWKNSGYRSVQAMGLSEHFELLFRVPSSSAPNLNRECPDKTSKGNCVDYLYSPSLDEFGLANGMWGLFRAYDPNKQAKKLQVLPNNTVAMNPNVKYLTCPETLTAPAVKRVFNIFAVTAQKALVDISPVQKPDGTPAVPRKGQIVFNNRGNVQTPPTPKNGKDVLHNVYGIMYVRAEDLINSNAAPGDPNYAKLKPDAPVEPLILRANAGDCIEVNLTNAIPKDSDLYTQNFQWAPPFNNSPVQTKASFNVGLHPQLLSYDAAQSNGINVGWNTEGQKDQVVGYGQTINYQWYAGKIERDGSGAQTYTPVEFGSLNLFPSDPVFQHFNGLFGSMIIEPQGSTWKCGEMGNPVDCDQSSSPPTTRASATVTLPNNKTFREFALMISDDILISPSTPGGKNNTSAVNYRTEPQSFRYSAFNNPPAKDFSCMLSSQLTQPVQRQFPPQTPIFTATVGDAVRFRMTHPFGTGTSQVFSLHGHVWQRNPYTTDSTVIGDNILSQWIGSRDNHGGSDHFDLLVDKAGGERGQVGDYLYTVFVPQQAQRGAWGLFRVVGQDGQTGQGPLISDPACLTQPPAAPAGKQKDERQLDRFIRQPVNDDNKSLKP
jgi:manganese oxidase